MHGAACWSPVLVAAASYTEVAVAVYAAGVAAPWAAGGRDSSDDGSGGVAAAWGADPQQALRLRLSCGRCRRGTRSSRDVYMHVYIHVALSAHRDEY